MQIVRCVCDADVAEHRTVFLSQSRHVEQGRCASVDMRRHADQGTHGDDARAADACNHDVVFARHHLGRFK